MKHDCCAARVHLTLAKTTATGSLRTAGTGRSRIAGVSVIGLDLAVGREGRDAFDKGTRRVHGSRSEALAGTKLGNVGGKQPADVDHGRLIIRSPCRDREGHQDGICVGVLHSLSNREFRISDYAVVDKL